jgi:hypothetical protein
MSQSRELDPETNQGVCVEGHLLDDALSSCVDLRLRQPEDAAPGDALLLVGGEAAESLAQRELAQGLHSRKEN